MNIEEQYNLIAEEYDANRKKFIPCFEDFYKGTTDFISANIRKPARVLDLGAGTGLLTRFWYEKFPDAEYLLVDIAEEMLSVARKRFSGTDNVSFRLMDYIKEFPTGNSDLIISALSVHHLENPEKSELFAKIYDMLPEGGAFVNYDQFRAGEPLMDEWFDIMLGKAAFPKAALTSMISGFGKSAESWTENVPQRNKRKCFASADIK